MMIAKQGIVMTHAIALTALLIVAMGWQAQVQKRPIQTSLMKLESPRWLGEGNVVALASDTAP
jgi:hypothetical protein